MNKHRSIAFMAWATALFLISITASCEAGRRWPSPDHVDSGAVRYAAGEVSTWPIAPYFKLNAASVVAT